MKIELEFDKKMTKAVAEGWKCCTFRTDRKGSIGDTFEVAGKTYRILQISNERLARVIYDFYAAEGFKSAKQMREWALKHYGTRYDLMMDGYVHYFARVPAETE